MILLTQVLLKNGLVSPAVFNKFIEITRDYGIDDLKIPYGDLKDIFASPQEYLCNKYGLKNLVHEDVFKEFNLLFPKPVVVPEVVVPEVVAEVVAEVVPETQEPKVQVTEPEVLKPKVSVPKTKVNKRKY